MNLGNTLSMFVKVCYWNSQINYKTIQTRLIVNRKTLFMTVTSRGVVLKLLPKLQNKNSSGHNQISNNLIKMKSTLSLPLILIFNKSIQTGIFPDCIKHTDVVPLCELKDKDKKEIKQYISWQHIFWMNVDDNMQLLKILIVNAWRDHRFQANLLVARDLFTQYKDNYFW